MNRFDMRKLAFLLDFDNTLFDNDRFLSQFHQFLDITIGPGNSKTFWSISKQLRDECGFVDYLGALQRYRIAAKSGEDLTGIGSFMFDYPFSSRVFPDAIQVLRQLQKWGKTVILTDGDMVFQPYKIKASGLWHQVAANVLIYIHKEQSLDKIQQACPAAHYVLVDDRLSILASFHDQLKERITTVFIHQGHYARESDQLPSAFSPDFTIQHISELIPVVQELRETTNMVN